MKNWKTTVLGILGAGLVLAKAKGWIDEQTAVFVGAVVVAVFGVVASDASSKQSLLDETDAIGNPFPKKR